MKKKINHKKKNSLIRILISSISRKGKKSKGVSISSNVIESLFISNKVSVKDIFAHVEIKLYSLISSKVVYFRKNTTVLPVALNRKQRNTTVISRLLKAISSDENRKSIADKIVYEMNSILLNKGSKSLALKESEIKQAVSNRANLRFRW